MHELGSVPTKQMQNFGFVIDIYEDFNNGTLKIYENAFKDIQLYNKKV